MAWVNFYEHVTYGGAILSWSGPAMGVPVALVLVPDLRDYGWNDVISSVQMSDDVFVILFEHIDYGGKIYPFSGYKSQLGVFNDLTSSLVIADNLGPLPQFFHDGFSGQIGFSIPDCYFPPEIDAPETFTPNVVVHLINRGATIDEGILPGGLAWKLSMHLSRIHLYCQGEVDGASGNIYELAWWTIPPESGGDERYTWYPPTPVSIRHFIGDLILPYKETDVKLKFFLRLEGTYKRQIYNHGFGTVKVGTFDIDFPEVAWEHTVEVHVPAGEIYPIPKFISTYISKDTVAPDEPFTITLVVENQSDNQGEFYLGYSCPPGVPWSEDVREVISAHETKTYEFTVTAESLAGRVFDSSEYISAEFAVGYVEPGMPVGEYRPDTITFRWTTPGIAVIVEDVPEKADLSGIVTVEDNLVEGAEVTIQGRTTATDSSGHYSFTGLNTGSHTLRCVKEGYPEWSRSVHLAEGLNVENITLGEVIRISWKAIAGFIGVAAIVGGITYALTRR